MCHTWIKQKAKEFSGTGAYLMWDNLLDFRTLIGIPPQDGLWLVHVFGNGRGGSYLVHLSIGKLIRPAVEELGTVISLQTAQYMPGTGSILTTALKPSRDHKMLHEEQGFCDGEGMVWKTLWRYHKRAFLKIPPAPALGNLPQERWTRSFSLPKGRERCSGGSGTRGGVQSSVPSSGLCPWFL